MNRIVKTAAVALAATVVASSMSFGAFAKTIRCGDANGDNKLTTVDALLIKKKISKWAVTIDEKAADYNRDGKIDVNDLTAVTRVLVGLDKDNGSYDDTPLQDVPELAGDKIFVNQIGYYPNADKTACVKASKSNQIYQCSLVDASTNTAVLTADTAKSKRYITTMGYAANFDFSSYTKEGTYYVKATIDGKDYRSYNFPIKKQANNEMQKALTTALYYNRCGQALDEKIVGKAYAHAACHNSSAGRNMIFDIFDSAEQKYTCDYDNIPSMDKYSGGLHDAGDYGRYTVPANGTVASLLATSKLFKKGAAVANVITDNPGENIDDCLDEARYEMKWLLKMQDPKDGGVYFRTVTKDFAGWTTMPDEDEMVLYTSRKFNQPTAGFAGNAAASYSAFKNIDPTFANQCLTAAKKAYDFVEKNRNNAEYNKQYSQGSELNAANAGEYGSNDVDSDFYYAAAALFRATGEAKYETAVKSFIDSGTPSFTEITGYKCGGAGSIEYLLNDKADATYKQTVLSKIVSAADSYRKSVEKNVYSDPCPSMDWGPNATGAQNMSVLAVADYFTGTKTNAKSIANALGFFYGRNPSGYCFVSNMGSKSPIFFHHRMRQHDYYSNCGYGSAQYQAYLNDPFGDYDFSKCTPMTGWLVGGFAKTGDAGTYIDSESDYRRNEVTIYWNTPLIMSNAYLCEIDGQF